MVYLKSVENVITLGKLIEERPCSPCNGTIFLVIYVYMFVDQKKIELYFSNRLTFSNIRGRTSRRIYRLALPLLSSKTLSSL